MMSMQRRKRVFLRLLVVSSTLNLIDAAPCTLCRDGEPVTRPDKIANIPGQGAFDCQTIHDFVPLILQTDQASCDQAHSLSTLCGCPREDNTCDLCPDGSSVLISQTELDIRLLPDFAHIFGGEAPSCELIEAYLHSHAIGDPFCTQATRSAAEYCGCPAESLIGIENSTDVDNELGGGSINFGVDVLAAFGARTPEQSTRRLRVARASSLLSILGSTAVFLDNMGKRKLKKNLYNKIMFSMAICDIVLSTAVVFGNLPSTTEDSFKFHGEKGNDATCTTQGFFIQLGSISSMLFNASLSTYYLLVIKHGARASRLQQLTKYMIGIPILVGLTFSFVGIPFYGPTFVGCHLIPPVGASSEFSRLDVFASTWGPFVGLWLAPAFMVVFYTTAALLTVYMYVRATNQRSNRWKLMSKLKSLSASVQERSRGSGKEGSSASSIIPSVPPRTNQRQSKSKKLQSEVFWQSLSYLFALYLSWFTYLVVITNIEEFLQYFQYYKLWVFVAFVYPLQGFLNAFVYFRVRLIARVRYYLQLGWAYRKSCARHTSPSSVEAALSVVSMPDQDVKDVANELVAANELTELAVINENDGQSEAEGKSKETPTSLLQGSDKVVNKADVVVVESIDLENCIEQASPGSIDCQAE